MLIQPVEWHMKKIEEEIVIDEKMYLLDEKTDAISKKDYSSNETSNKNGSQTTLPAATDFNAKADSKSVSSKEKKMKQSPERAKNKDGMI